MKKKKNSTTEVSTPVIASLAPVNFFLVLKNQLAIIVLLVIAFYGNTLFNEYALDDVVSITGNKFTQKGFAGISTLFFKDSFYGYFGDSSGLSGGRWRPLSLITFAIEQQFFGASATINHLNNILIFMFTGAVLLLFLRKYVFPSQAGIALLATVLIIIHPIHTEAVANIKSRDELLSFLFLILTLHFAMHYLKQGKKMIHLLLGCVFYFLALLSKENGLTFIAIIPLSFYFFYTENIKKCLLLSIPYIVTAVIYMLIRISLVGFSYHEIHDVNISPLSNATTVEWWGTIFLALGKYIGLLFFPHPLSADYSYNQIPYVDFSNIKVWLSVLIQLALLIFAIVKLKTKDLLSYGILFYFFSISIVSNLVIDVGATLGERFLYQASLGFCLCLAVIFNTLYQKLGSIKKYSAIAFLSIIILLSATKTISRNAEWKNDQTLFLKDVQTCPNSIRTNIAAGTALIINAQKESDSLKRVDLLNRSIIYLEKALVISPSAADPVLNMGVAYFNLGNYEMAEKMWQLAKEKGRIAEVQQYEKSLSTNLMNKGLLYASQKNYNRSISCFYKAIGADSMNHNAWYNLGGAYFTIARYDSASLAWEKTLQIKPDFENAKKGLEAAKSMSVKK
ncbi:MAG: tetratricopeptide repeat protein [Bacteroidetes bacterium]|nr:tetratricopeptide repeat protein [Bacteroidota bacterium]